MTTIMLPIEARTPSRIESAPSDGPTVRSSRYLIEAGSAPARSTSAKSFAESCAEISFDQSGIVDAAFDLRRGMYLVVENNGHRLADMRFGERTESRCSGAVESVKLT